MLLKNIFLIYSINIQSLIFSLFLLLFIINFNKNIFNITIFISYSVQDVRKQKDNLSTNLQRP